MNILKFIEGGWTLIGLHVTRLRYQYAIVISVLLVAFGSIGYALFLPPASFPTSKPVVVVSGTSAAHEAAVLRDAGYIRSTLLFRLLFRFMPGTRGVLSGTYVFKQPAGEFTVAWNMAHGIAGVPTVRLTFPEGTTARQMGAMLARSLPAFDENKFDTIAIPAEGELFPDTYFFLPGTTEEAAMDLMRANFAAHIAKYQEQIANSGHSEREILTMASLLEGEGKTLEDRRIIAGILWNRIRSGMRLQVDAPFGYIYGVTGYTPTGADLASNSAYNTYRYKGLPPTPINNPGDESIEAALTPAKTDYLYYLTGTDGQMHYAKTFAEHIANEKKYLSK